MTETVIHFGADDGREVEASQSPGGGGGGDKHSFTTWPMGLCPKSKCVLKNVFTLTDSGKPDAVSSKHLDVELLAVQV